MRRRMPQKVRTIQLVQQEPRLLLHALAVSARGNPQKEE
jgi:hypothetical protein